MLRLYKPSGRIRINPFVFSSASACNMAFNPSEAPLRTKLPDLKGLDSLSSQQQYSQSLPKAVTF